MRAWARFVVAAVVTGAIASPTAAFAESCLSLPVSTTGLTISGGGQEVRVPAYSDLQVCLQLPGVVGTPRVESSGGATSVIVYQSGASDGYVAARGTADGAAWETRVPVPGVGGGGSGETCVFSIGAPARHDCEFKISFDEPVCADPICVPPGSTNPKDLIAYVKGVVEELLSGICFDPDNPFVTCA